MSLQRRLSRRAALRLLGGSATVAALPLLLACGDDDTPATTASGAATPRAGGTSTAPASGSSATPASSASPAAGTPATGTPGTRATPAGGTPVASSQGGSLTVYSGRSESLVGKLMEQFKKDTGIDARVRYGDSAELAAAILDEGRNSPADVFFSQDAGAIGAVAKEGRFQTLSTDILNLVDQRFRAPNGSWVGVSGRARAVVYNTAKLKETDIPASILGFTDARWKDKLGWAPTNASLQAFVTALRLVEGDAKARDWLRGIKNNNARAYQNNNAVVRAVISGEIEAGFVNHYYLYGQLKEMGQQAIANPPAQNYIYRNGDPGALVNVAGAAILRDATNLRPAETFVRYLLSPAAQTYFSNETFEYPLIAGAQPDPRLVPLAQIRTPAIDLSDLDDLQGTLAMMRDVGVL